MALEIPMQCSAKTSPRPGTFSTMSKRETSQQQHECQSDKPGLEPKQENASDCEGLVHNTKEVDEVVSRQCNGNTIKCKSNNRNKVGSGGGGRGGICRRGIARGPRSGSGGNGSMLTVGWEDHRVVSTEYHRWSRGEEVEVVMKVTLLAAGFVIGARGATAREIGQATGALLQSWTETYFAHPAAMPVRLFRIQGYKRAVQAAVYLIHEAVAKYKDLCECKIRGEFVQREHVINGVEFFYQPPPKKALPLVKNNTESLNCSRNHVWSIPQLHSPACGCNCFVPFKHHNHFKPQDVVYDRHLVSSDKNRGLDTRSRYPWPGLFHYQAQGKEETPKSMKITHKNISAEKVLAMEEKLEKLDMEDENEKKKRTVDPWSVLVQEREKQDQMNPSLFSYFGPDGLPLPITHFSSKSDFDFASCEFLGGRFPSFSFASSVTSKTLGNPEQEKLNSINERSDWPPYVLF